MDFFHLLNLTKQSTHFRSRKCLLIALVCLASAKSFAQFADDFSDADFTVNPHWQGDTPNFVINSNKQLQLNASQAGSSYLSVSCPVSALNNMEWRCYVKQSFSPSANNYGRVYLVSDQANLKGSLNGYFLQFGEAGSNDAIELFRQNGTTLSSLCRGQNTAIANPFAVSLKVIRDSLGFWKLYADYNAGINYQLEATAQDTVFHNSAFMGLWANYTSSNTTKFYYDNFYAGPVYSDAIPPQLQQLTVVSATQIDLLFNECIDTAKAKNSSSYLTYNNGTQASVIVGDNSNCRVIHLYFNTPFISAQQDSLYISGLQDLSGNVLSPAAYPFTWYTTISGAYKDVIITEIMADPNPSNGQPNAEYLELYNRSGQYINLSGWKISDNPGSGAVVTHTYLLAPGAYALLLDEADTNLFAGIPNKIGLNSFPGLNDTGDRLYLKNNNGVPIDSIHYQNTWYKNEEKDKGGWSLELINPEAEINCPTENNWTASQHPSGGSPGTQNTVYAASADTMGPQLSSIEVADSLHLILYFNEYMDTLQLLQTAAYNISNGINTAQVELNQPVNNSVKITLANPLSNKTIYTIFFSGLGDCSGNPLSSTNADFTYYIPQSYDVLIHEIMCDPDPPQALPEYEYIELYNRSAYDISLNNWTIDISGHIKTIGKLSIHPDSFVVLAGTQAYAAYAGSGLPVYNISGFPALNNSGAIITLRNATGKVIHTIAYADTWYADEVKAEGGYSLEMRDAKNPCGEADNWRASNATQGGTPGRENSVKANYPDTKVPQLSYIRVNSPTAITLFFDEIVDSLSLINNWSYNIDKGIGSPTTVLPMEPDFRSVQLILSEALQLKTIYTCTVSGIYDCVGNNMNNNSLAFAIPEAVAANDVVINEIMFDPLSGSREWIELYNRSDKNIEAGTLLLARYDSISGQSYDCKITGGKGFILFPGNYMLMSENADAVFNEYYSPNPTHSLNVPDMPALYNAATISICDSLCNTIDHVFYSERMHFPLLSITRGVSLERIDFNRPGTDKTNWNSAASGCGFATPAYQNSQYLKAEQGEEIKVTPEIFSPDNDGYNDVLNITYTFAEGGKVANILILDLEGNVIRHLVRNEMLAQSGTCTWNGINEQNEKAPAGIYVIYAEFFDVKGNVNKHKLSVTLANKLR